MLMTSAHIHAIELPFGTTPRSLWVVDGWLTATPATDATTIEGRFVSSGLVDAHAHLTLDVSGGTVAWSDRAELASTNARSQREAGVTVVRDAGVVGGVSLDHVRELTVIGSGGMLAPPGRYHAGFATEVRADDLVEYVHVQVARGARWVKLIADFPGADGDWFNAPPTYPIETVARAVRVAHAGGARVAAHVSSGLVADLVRVGVDSIEHGPLMTPALVEEMAERGAAWTPTLSTVFAKHLDPMVRAGGPLAEYLREVYATMERSLRRAVELGVPIMAGTDEGEHGSIALELEQLRRFGLTGAEAFAAATTWPRAYLGLPALEEDAPADLVLYDADPRERQARPVAVVANGRLVK